MDTLSSLMEVKLDIREKRTEWLPLRVSAGSAESSWNCVIYFLVFVYFTSHGRGATSRSRRSSAFPAT